MMRLLLIFFSLVHVFHLFGQYQVINATTNKPVPYTRIKVANEPRGMITNFKGEFFIDSTFDSADTLEVYCIGYILLKVKVAHLLDAPVILLEMNSKPLKVVNITATKKKFSKRRIGVTKNPKTKFFDFSITGDNGYERATLIPNTYSTTGSIQSVNIYITNTGFANAHFRLHIYECSPLLIGPGKELTTRNIISSGTIGNEWVNINLKNENIELPINGCYIGVEWFDSPQSIFFKDTLLKKGVSYRSGESRDTVYSIVRKGNGAVLGSISEAYKYSKNKTWLRNYIDTSWVNQSELFDYESRFYIPDTLHKGYVHIPNESNYFTKTPCINMEVLYDKGKIKPDFNKPKGRKLNKIGKVKKDLYNYPQSNISQLFLSLATAFENDNVVYALKYLCVYEGDEFKIILEELYSDDELSEEQRLKTAMRIRNIEKKLIASELIQIDAVHYELKIEADVFQLILEKGIWKINPYSTKRIKLL